jgi:hypothetical protein
MTSFAAPLADAVAGMAGTIVGKFATYPLDFLKVRVQVSGAGVTQSEIISKVYAADGLIGFYAGCGAKVTKSSIQKFIMFFLQRILGQKYRSTFMRGRCDGARVDTVPYMIISWLGEILGLPVIIPIETIVTRLQTSTNGESVLNHLRDIQNQPGGVMSLFNSFPAYFFTCMQPGIQFPVFEWLKAKRIRRLAQRLGEKGVAVSENELQMGWMESFLIGAVSKGFAQIITFPFERTRSKFQALQKSGKATSVFAVMLSMFREEGFGMPFLGTGMWKGVFADLYQGVLNAALMMMVKEQLTTLVKSAIFRVLGTSENVHTRSKESF